MSLFITFEGPEGSGKSTQARRLYERFTASGYPAIQTKEPGGTPIGEQIRHLLLDPQYAEMDPTTEILLFAAARAQHLAELIRPFLERGGVVICDRYADSTFAYQGYGLGRDLDELRTITRIATGGLMPDTTIFLDVPVTAGLDRKRAALADATSADAESAPPPEWNRLDDRALAFHNRVYQGYQHLIAAEPERWLCFDGNLDRDLLADTIWERLEPRLAALKPLAKVGL